MIHKRYIDCSKVVGYRLLLTAFAFLLFAGVSPVVAETLNEWGFTSDPEGLTLSQVGNAGSIGAVFSPGGSGFLETDGQGNLLATHDDSGTSGMWTEGAILDAALPSTVSTGIQYLRYDFSYDLSDVSGLNDSGAAIGFAFYDGSGDRVAGVFLEYDVEASATPSDLDVTEFEVLTNMTGTVTVIAKINLASSTMDVWYDFAGDVSGFSQFSPSASMAVSLSSFDALRFQATGDIRPAGSTDEVAVGLLRTADTWSSVIADEGIFLPELQVAVAAATSLEIGETGVVTVVINNDAESATEVTSALVHDGDASDFTIISNNTPTSLASGASLTNTYRVIPNASGSYQFSVQARSAEAIGATTNFNLVAGSQISYLTNSVVEVSGGILHGRYEPGETLDITVASINDGGRPVSGITNTLSPNLSIFTSPVPVSEIYSSMVVGAVTSTTYRVTIRENTPAGTYIFGVTNQTNGKVWSDSFPLTVFAEAIPSVSPLSIVLNAVEGGGDSETVTVMNSGNAPLSFTVTDDGAWGVVYAEYADDVNFSTAARTVITLNGSSPETAGISDVIDFGFNFSFYGTEYSKFYVTSDGVIGLSNSTNTPAPGAIYGTLPSASGLPLISPFWGDLRSPFGSIRYSANADFVVISWLGVDNRLGGGTDLEFQALLYANGRIEFRYEEINGDRLDRVTVGIQGDADHYRNLSMTPVSDASVLLTPQENDAWVTYSPHSGPVAPQSTAIVTFMLDAAGQTLGSSNRFTAHFNFSTGSASNVLVSAAVTPPMPEYSAAEDIFFSGPAGQITSVPFVITNTGTGLLEFTISDNLSAAAGYITNNTTFSWVDISSAGIPVVLNDPSPSSYITPEDEGFSDMIPLKFPFPFYGGSYTQLSVSVNGTLSLDRAGRIFALWNLASTHSSMPEQMIAPLWGELLMDENSSVKYYSTPQEIVVTWENLSEYGRDAGSNLTFQTILRSDGEILFQHKPLDGSRWPSNIVGLRDTTNRTIQVDIQQLGDGGTGWALQFEPAQIQTIRYTPGGGSIAAGGTAEITIIGDASNQSVGGNTAGADVVLEIAHTAGTNTLDVTFVATNSLQPVFVSQALADDSDGDGMADDAERIAGTDMMDAASVFMPEVMPSKLGPLLSWEEPLDGWQRIYNIYWTTNLVSQWSHLATVTNGTTYLDSKHVDEQSNFYKVTVE